MKDTKVLEKKVKLDRVNNEKKKRHYSFWCPLRESQVGRKVTDILGYIFILTYCRSLQLHASKSKITSLALRKTWFA